jgi:hypothetical protein
LELTSSSKVIPLEVFETEFHAQLELFDRLDFFSQQALAGLFQRRDQTAQGVRGHALDIDLDDVDQRDQLIEFGRMLDDVVDGELEAEVFEFVHPRQQLRRGFDGFQDFENDLMRLQEAHEVAHQDHSVDIYEGKLIAYYLLHAKLGRM